MKQQVHYFLTALLFFTRIPCPKWVNHSAENINKSSRYFPLVGIIVGSIGAITYFGAQFILPTNIAIIISMLSTIWVTGAFHEDGFADVCDGFGGGWTTDKILTIMKDSRLGTFGVTGLIAILALKFLALFHLQEASQNIILILIAGHAISRFFATLLVYTHEYVRDASSSKLKTTPLKMSTKSLLIAAFFGLLPLFFFTSYIVFLSIIPLLLTYGYLSRLFKKWIGGQTGDCAGALQQVSEVVFYISILIYGNYFS